MSKETDPVSVEVIKHFQKIRAEQEYLKQASIHINYVKPIMFKGKKVFALGNKVYTNCLPIPLSTHFSYKFLKKRLALIGFVNK